MPNSLCNVYVKPLTYTHERSPMTFLKRKLLAGLAFASLTSGLVALPAQALPAVPQLSFTQQSDMGTVLSSITTGSGDNIKVFTINGDYAVSMETALPDGVKVTQLDIGSCLAMDITVDSTYLWVLCQDMSGQRILLSSITTVSNAALTKSSFSVPSTAYSYSSCNLSEIFSDGTYVGVSDSRAHVYQLEANFTSGLNPTMAPIDSRGFPSFNCYQYIQPLVVADKTYNVYFDYHYTGRLIIVKMSSQWAELSDPAVYGTDVFRSVSINSGQLWAYQARQDKALRYDPSDLSIAPFVDQLSETAIYDMAFDGTNVWTTRDDNDTFPADVRSASTGLITANSNLSGPSLVVRFGSKIYAVAAGAWYSATAPVASAAPGLPTGLTISVNNGTATLKWSAPANHGATAIKRYDVRVTNGFGPTVGTCSTKALTCSVDISSQGYGKVFRANVSATNTSGTSDSALSTNYAIAGEQTLFADTSGVLTMAQKTTISNWLKGVCTRTACLSYPITVTGYTDASASGALAAQQSRARANAVAAYIRYMLGTRVAQFSMRIDVRIGGATNVWDKTSLAGNRRVMLSFVPVS